MPICHFGLLSNNPVWNVNIDTKKTRLKNVLILERKIMQKILGLTNDEISREWRKSKHIDFDSFFLSTCTVDVK